MVMSQLKLACMLIEYCYPDLYARTNHNKNRNTGMKTGTVAKRFDLDQKTIKIWTDMFPDYFTDGALGEGRTQRDYQMEDLSILNTIKIERSRNIPFEQIGAKLAA